jgi:hypothetical protein
VVHTRTAVRTAMHRRQCTCTADGHDSKKMAKKVGVRVNTRIFQKGQHQLA